ncbi:hypothetical protein TorRG33x02_245410 [Trema orientale]|uniref:Uncharacterized protein n=1 Tax=Trema orientale TaxID=63057 RepID=A0A2P5DPN9_TREOI|nr:hypothetical protein TorRG33x02_245410 [Trema orientale]
MFCQFMWHRAVTLNKHLLEIIKDISVMHSQERCSNPSLPCTTSTPNTMSVHFNISWHIIVNDMSHIRYVNPTPSNICSNKDIISFGSKPFKADLSLLLRFPTMQSRHTIACLIQILGHTISILLGVNKDNGSLITKLIKQPL